jgi:hypothetical protein
MALSLCCQICHQKPSEYDFAAPRQERMARLLAFPISRSHALVLLLNGRKFGNSVSQFSDTTLEIGPGGVTPFFAGLCASIEPHTFFCKLLKNLELARTKDNLGSPRKFSSNPSNIFEERLPWRGKGAQIQIQEQIKIAGKPSIILFFHPCLQVIGCRHDQIIDDVGVGLLQQCVLAKQLAAVADIFIIRTRTAILILRCNRRRALPMLRSYVSPPAASNIFLSSSGSSVLEKIAWASSFIRSVFAAANSKDEQRLSL